MQRQTPAQMAIMAGLCVGFGVLLAFAARSSLFSDLVGSSEVNGYWGLAVLFVVYLAPTILALVLPEARVVARP
jgi:formate/nitrite transporter FocA (FNT family)